MNKLSIDLYSGKPLILPDTAAETAAYVDKQVEAERQRADNKVAAHDADEAAHANIRQAVAAEATDRQQGDTDTLSAATQVADSKVAAHNSDEAAHADIRQAVADEATARQQADQTVDNRISTLNSTIGQVADNFNTHDDDEVRHVTNDDRARWDNREIAKVFDTAEEMNMWLSDPTNTASLVVGQSIFIRNLNEQDYWWDGNQALAQNSKTDLSDYDNRSELDTKVSNAVTSANAYADGSVAQERNRAEGVEAGKAPVVHSHTKAQITDFPAALPPTGNAGGALNGSYPNPVLANINPTQTVMSVSLSPGATFQAVENFSLRADGRIPHFNLKNYTLPPAPIMPSVPMTAGGEFDLIIKRHSINAPADIVTAQFYRIGDICHINMERLFFEDWFQTLYLQGLPFQIADKYETITGIQALNMDTYYPAIAFANRVNADTIAAYWYQQVDYLSLSIFYKCM